MRTGVLQTLSENGASFSTLASHNRRLVRCGKTYALTVAESVDGRRQVRFMRSRDEGRTFFTFDRIPAGPQDYRPAGLAVDKDGALFAFYPEEGATDIDHGKCWFLRKYETRKELLALIFEKDMGFGGSNNFSTCYDAVRNVIHYATIIDSTAQRRCNNLFAIDPETGRIVSQQALTLSTECSGFHYPHFAMWGGDLFLAWTSWDHQQRRYDGVGIIRSADGGETWTTLGGRQLELPIDARPTGPAEQLVMQEDRRASTWLANMVSHGSALHLFYCARGEPAWQQRYLRYDLRASRWDRIGPRWGGATLAINGIDGFFLSGSDRLFAVGNQSGSAIVVLVSTDAGAHWEDFGSVAMPDGFVPYGLHGCLTEAEDIIGLLTACPAQAGAGQYKVMSFRMETR